ncbi:MAG: ABC transporter permease, partial [Kiloniellales bacterium]
MTDLAGTPSQAPTSWRLALRLARRELRTGTKGFRIFLACIALGVATIAAVGSISEAMLAGLREDGRVLLGGDLDLHLHHREITAEQRAWLEARATISEVAAMRAMAQPTTEDAARRLVELRAVDDAYPLYGAAVLDPAADLRTVLGRRDGVWGAA